MPIYLYNYLDEQGKPTGEQVELFQSMKENSLEIHPKNGRKISRAICLPAIIIDSRKPKTVGELADKNTKEMEKRGDPRVQKKKNRPKPFWQTSDKPLNITKWSSKQKEKYIMEGKKP